MSGTKKSKKAPYVPVPSDGGYGWMVLCSCFMISLLLDGCMYSIGVVLGEIQKAFKVSSEVVNLLPSLNTGFLFCSGPIVSGLSSQFGIRPVVIGGAIVTSLVYIFSAYSPNIYYMMAAYGVVGGISTGCTYISSLIIIAHYFNKKLGVANGITMSGSGVGAFIFAPLIKYLITLFDWQFTMIIIACVVLQCVVMGALLRPAPSAAQLASAKGAKEAGLSSSAADHNNVTSFIGSMVSVGAASQHDEDVSCLRNCFNISTNILKEMTDIRLLKENIGFLLITLSAFFIFAGYFIPFYFIPKRAEELQLDNYAWILSIIGIVNIPARLGFGTLADLKFISAVNLNTICCVLTTLSLFAYGMLNTFALQITFAVVFAVGIGGMNSLATPYLKEIVGQKKFDNAMGILNLFRGFGCFIGPFLGGFICDKTGSSLGAFYYSGAAVAIGTVFSALVSFGSVLKILKKETQYEKADAAQTTANATELVDVTANVV